jgi:hypothetical protein
VTRFSCAWILPVRVTYPGSRSAISFPTGSEASSARFFARGQEFIPVSVPLLDLLGFRRVLSALFAGESQTTFGAFSRCHGTAGGFVFSSSVALLSSLCPVVDSGARFDSDFAAVLIIEILGCRIKARGLLVLYRVFSYFLIIYIRYLIKYV